MYIVRQTKFNTNVDQQTQKLQLSGTQVLLDLNNTLQLKDYQFSTSANDFSLQLKLPHQPLN